MTNSRVKISGVKKMKMSLIKNSIKRNRIKILVLLLPIATITCLVCQKYYVMSPKYDYSISRSISSLSMDKIPKTISESRSLTTFSSTFTNTTRNTASKNLNNNNNKKKTINADFSNVIFIGDSITYGFIRAHNTPVKNDHVYAKIGAHVFEGSKLLGYDINLIKKRCNGSVDYIFIMFGANDYSYDMKSYKIWYEDLVDHIQEMFPKAKIILQSVMPMKSTVKEPTRDQEPEKLNNVVKNIANEEKVQYIDISESIPDAYKYFLADGLHFKPELYPLWINVIRSKEEQLKD